MSDVRLAEVEQLEDARDDSGMLVRFLIEGDERVRARAARALGRLQDPSVVPALARAARSDDDKKVRYEALFALGQYGLAEQLDWRGPEAPVESVAVETVVSLLEDPDDARTWVLATEALGKLAPQVVDVDAGVNAEARLIEQIGSDAAAVREAAAHALFRLRFAPLWRGQTDAPPEWSDAAVVALGGALEDENPLVREAAAHAFSRWGEARANEALVRYLTSPLATTERVDREWTPVFALRALGRGGDSAPAGMLDAVVSMLGDDDLHVRLEAVNALATLSSQRLVPTSLVEDPSWLVRAAAASAWGALSTGKALGDGEVTTALERLLDDPSYGVRSAALVSTAQRQGAAQLDLIDRFRTSDDYRLRSAAVRATEHLPVDEAAGRLRQALRDPDSRVVVAAIEPLAELATRIRFADPKEWFSDTLARRDLAVRGTVLTVLPDLLRRPGVELPDLASQLETAYQESTGTEWIEVREQLMEAASELSEIEGAPDLLPLLRRGLKDPAPSVAVLARDGLRAQGQAAELPQTPREPEVTRRDPPTREAVLEVQSAQAPIVVLETDKGTMRVQTLPADAPWHVANFVQLVQEGFYDGLLWHRVAPNFVIQGGDPRGDGWGGPGYTLRDEIHLGQRYRRGTLGMPKAGKDTGGCQLFFTHIPTPHLDGNYTVFGQVIEGLEVIDAIEIGDRIVRATVE